MQNNKEKSEMREFIREKVKRYSKAANAIFWVGILNIFSFILLLFRGGIPRLGFALNIYFHVLFMNMFEGSLPAFLFSGLAILILSLVYFLFTPSIKSGKLIPLIFTGFLYLADTVFLIFMDENFFPDITDRIISILVHIVVLGYYLFLFLYFHRIVKLSKSNQKEFAKKRKKE